MQTQIPTLLDDQGKLKRTPRYIVYAGAVGLGLLSALFLASYSSEAQTGQFLTDSLTLEQQLADIAALRTANAIELSTSKSKVSELMNQLTQEQSRLDQARLVRENLKLEEDKLINSPAQT